MDRNILAENYAKWRLLSPDKQEALRSEFGLTSSGEENLPHPDEFSKLPEGTLPELEEVKEVEEVKIKAEVEIKPKKKVVKREIKTKKTKK